DGAAEDLEGAGPEFLREIGELHAEAEVGLVDTETIERLVEGEPAERRGNVHVKRRLPDAFQQAFDQSVNVLAFDERHLDVHLGELELAIGALVFVAIAAGELEIFFHAADHEDLLELLRGLRQRVEFARLATAGDEELARAFGGGLEERGRFDFEETLFVEENAGGGGDLAAQAEVAGHLGTAQVKIAVLQAQFLVHLGGDLRIVHGERQDFGHVVDFKRGDGDFDFTGGNLGIVGAFGAAAHLAGDADHAFAAQGGGAVEEVLGHVGGVKDRLRAAFAVADVDEDQAAEIAAGMDPTRQGHRLPDVRQAQFVAMMRAFHELTSNRSRRPARARPPAREAPAEAEG